MYTAAIILSTDSINVEMTLSRVMSVSPSRIIDTRSQKEGKNGKAVDVGSRRNVGGSFSA